jgi:hypothetical protein
MADKKSQKPPTSGPKKPIGERGDVGPEPRFRAWIEHRFSKAGADRRANAIHPGKKSYGESFRAWRALRAAPAPAAPLKAGAPPAPPAPPPATNWVPIGPSVVRRGQAAGAPPVSGRAADIAIAPGAARVYAATANGGVWRSDDQGATWTSTMDGLDLGPTHVDSDSLACGAIAINPSNPDRVYVGTGEGESAYFFNWVLGVVYSYAGVGPLRSDTGGTGAWISEPIAPGSPTLSGQAFFALAVDPTDAERVVGATTAGIYRREPDGMGGVQWRQTHAGDCTSVVVAITAGTVAWYAAMHGGPVLTSSDGATWNPVGAGFPAGVTRVSLAVQPTNTGTIYAFSSAGVHRLDLSNGTWRLVTSSITVDSGEYGAAIAVDPNDVTRIFIGAYGGGPSGDANINRGVVTSSGSGASLAYSYAGTDIGSGVHPDVHRLVVRSDAANEMWVACDGGIFRTTSADAGTSFESKNVGLMTMTCTYLDFHPTEAAVIFCGAQDNGTLRYTGEEAWLHSADGDGGPVVVNWNNPYQILRTYVYGTIDRATDGGAGPGSWSDVTPASSGALFYPPLVGAPISGTPSDADRVATGADRTWFSDTFGTSWSSPDAAALAGTVSALVFANASRVYAGTSTGNVYVYTRPGATWSAASLIGPVGGAASAGVAPIVTAIAVDPADATGHSFYVCLGGVGDWRRVWHYDGTAWAARSGPSAGAATALIDVDFNALAVDPANAAHVFAGADIGVWESTDGGANWAPYAEGLPEAGVSDLRIHASRRLIRAATYGRGVYERELDAVSAAGIELYVRDTDLDVGLWPTVDWLADPESTTTPPAQVRHWESPNVKVDPPASSGTYQITKQINFFQFVDQLVDGSEGVATIDSSLGTAVNRVYVEVHNRGVTQADGVQVMLLLANASAGLSAAPLPAGYAANVQAGIPISNANWQTVGIKTINGLHVGIPQVVEFDLPSTMLPPPSSLPAQSHYCLLAILHHPSDQFNNTQQNADALTIADRKVGQRNLQIVNFTGTLPPPDSPGTPLGTMSALVGLFGGGRQTDLVIDTSQMKGAVTLLLPKEIDVAKLGDAIRGGKLLKAGQLDSVVEKQLRVVEDALRCGRCSAAWARTAIEALKGHAGGTPIRFAAQPKARFAGIKGLRFAKPAQAVLAFDAPQGAKPGDSWETAVMLVNPGGTVAGGNTYRCRVVLPPDDHRDVQIDADVVRTDAKSWSLAVRLTSGGKAATGKDGQVFAVAFTAQGMVQPPQKLPWDAGRKAFAGTIVRMQGGAAVRCLTIVGRVGKLEGRKTISLR